MKRLGVIGAMVWDEIHGRDPAAPPVEEWGGVAYALGGNRRPVALGPAEFAVPSADGKAVWVVFHGVATRVPLAGGAHRPTRLPPKTRLVGDTPYGLIVSAGARNWPPALLTSTSRRPWRSRKPSKKRSTASSSRMSSASGASPAARS